jgi:hypothetical protein
VHINPDNNNNAMKKQAVFLAGIKLQMKTTPKEYLSLTNHESTLPPENDRMIAAFQEKQADPNGFSRKAR